MIIKLILIYLLCINYNITGTQCKGESINLNLRHIADTFIKYFNDRDFNHKLTSRLFNNIQSDQWWMSGDKDKYPFVGWSTIGNRMNSFFPIVIGFDKWVFIENDKLIDWDTHKIMLEIKAFGIGYGNRPYKNEYLFILSINPIGKIYQIKEYLDSSGVENYFKNNTLLEQHLNNFKK